MRNKVQYFKCGVCNRTMPIKYGEMTNAGFRCDRHNKPFIVKVAVYRCSKCKRPVIKDLLNRDIDSGAMVCVTCSGDKALRFRQHAMGRNYGEHMSRKRHRLMKKHKRY